MEKEIKIKCPCCDTIIFVDRITGIITETRKPLVKDSTGDRLQDAFLKAEQDKERLASTFDDLKDKVERKKKLAESLFNASLEEAKKEKPGKPHNIFDVD